MLQRELSEGINAMMLVGRPFLLKVQYPPTGLRFCETGLVLCTVVYIWAILIGRNPADRGRM